MTALFVIARSRGGAQRACAAALLSAFWVASLAAPALAWRQEIAGSRDDGSDIAHAHVLDAAGNVIVAGTLDNDDDGFAFLVVKLAAASGAELWRQEINGSAGVTQGALAVTVDAAGDVIAAGELDLDFTIIKFSGVSGAELWRLQVDGSDTFETVEEARAVAVDAAGDVFATGFVGNSGTGRDLFVVKCDGSSGGELWRSQIDGGDGQADRASAIAVTAAGDVLAAGRLATAAVEDDFTVVKLAGAGGAELWRQRIDGSEGSDDEVLALTLDASGNAVAAGFIDNAGTEEDFSVVKLAAASGSVLWRRDIDGGLGGSITHEAANAVAIDASGNVVAAGSLEYVNRYHDFTVIKFAAADGSEIWRREIEGDMVAASDIAYAVDIDPAGDVVAAGRIENGPRPSFDFSVVKMSGTTGAEIWRQMIDGSNDLGPRLEEVRTVSVDGSGDIVASGFVDNDDAYRDLAVLKLDGTTGIVGTARGTKIRLLDYEGRPEKRLLSFDMFDAAIWTPPPGDPNDPALVGAEIRIVNPTTLEETTFVLPPGPGWTASGSPPGAYGYTYADDGSNGPCTLFQARPYNRIRASCSGKRGPIPFTLDEVSQGSIAITVRFGSSALQCAVFGGKVRKDVGTSNPGPHAAFQAVAARSALGTACP